jgi:polysaccharide pyruvyl transferase WcaK-like protein
MKVGLLNVYSTRNLGDCAIYGALAKMTPSGMVHAVRADAQPVLVPGVEYKRALHDCDMFISVGGDIFNNGRPRLVARRFLKNVSEIRQRADRTICFGQSIPPSCRGVAARYLSASLRRLPAVAVRDEESHAQLREAKVPSVLTYDTAFTLKTPEAARTAARTAYEAAHLDPEKTVVLSLRGHSSLYEGDKNRQESAIGELLKALQDRGHQTAIVIQADHGSADTDWALARSLKRELPATRILDPFEAELPMPPYELFAGMLAIAGGVAAVRYHGAVLRLTAGRMAYVLHYSNKGADLCRRLDVPGGRLGTLGIDEMVKGIESSMGASFNVAPVANHVRSAFDACLARVQ